MLTKSTMKKIPLAIAMTAVLMFSAGAQAQATGGSASPPAGPNSTPKTMEQRDTAKPMAGAGMNKDVSGGMGGKASPPTDANAMPKTMEQRDAAKPMMGSGTDNMASGMGGKANPPAGPNTMSKAKKHRNKAKPMARLDKLPQGDSRSTSR